MRLRDPAAHAARPIVLHRASVVCPALSCWRRGNGCRARHRQPAAAAAAVATCWRCWPTSSAARRCTRRSRVTAAEVVVAFVIAVPLGAAIGVLAAESDYFGADLQADAVLRVQRAEIDLPADVHPGVRHRLPAEGRLRRVLHASSSSS